MKKTDIVTIAIVLLIAVSFYVYYSLNHLVTNDTTIQVIYNDQIVYEVGWTEDLDMTIALGTREYWTEEEISAHQIDKVVFVEDDIINVIRITGRLITMAEANCTRKDCLSMYIDRGVIKSIDCVDNDVRVRLDSNEFGGIITGGIIWWK
jgi:hypothetical protein